MRFSPYKAERRLAGDKRARRNSTTTRWLLPIACCLAGLLAVALYHLDQSNSLPDVQGDEDERKGAVEQPMLIGAPQRDPQGDVSARVSSGEEQGTCELLIRVLMPDGTPLPGFGTRVRAMHGDQPTNDSLAKSVTDADGEVHVNELKPGRVYCEVGFSHMSVSKVVDVLPRQHNVVTLRSPVGLVWLTGRVLRNGAPVANRRVTGTGLARSTPRSWFSVTTSAEGRYQAVLTPGEYTLRVDGAPCDFRGGRWNYTWWQKGGSGPAALKHVVAIGAGSHKVTKDLILAGSSVTCIVRRRDNDAVVKNARVIIDLKSRGRDGEPASKTTDALGRVSFFDLPLARLSAFVTAKGFADSLSQTFELSSSALHRELQFALDPATRVSVTLLNVSGKEIHFSRVGRPAIRHTTTGRTFHGRLPPSKGGHIRSPLIFDGVLLGEVAASLEDVREGDTLTYNRYGPPMTKTVTLVADTPAAIRFEGVVPRTAVTLHALVDGKRSDANATISVTNHERLMMGQSRWRSLDDRENPHQWLGYLVPGRYRVRVNFGSGASRDDVIDVGRSTLEKKYVDH